MKILPAIDIRGGKCVRLLRGDYDQETVFGDDPAEMAERWLAQGAEALHIVDLDGARDGASTNRDAVQRILAAAAAARPGASGDASGTEGEGFVTELGGGIRDLAGIDAWIATGLGRVILGTAAVRDPELVSLASAKHGRRVWVGIDARGGRVAVSGWTETSELDAVEFARDVARRGAGGIIYTDIDRDGTGDGVNIEQTARLADAVDIPVIASGGVHTAEDVRRLNAVASSGITGVIVGRALYDGTTTLAELMEAAA